MDMTAKLEALAAGPKPFVAIQKWRHDDGRVEIRELAQPRRAMAENFASRYRPHVGRTYDKPEGGRVTLESVEVIERRA